ncbi:MAG: DUF983 domain-containing protein [Actinomycetota bacterium]
MSHRLRVPVSAHHPYAGRFRDVVRVAMLRGLRRRCPNCGDCRSLVGYLTVVPACDCCGEPLGHIRADDGPAYFTVLLVGHIVVPLSLLAEQTWHPPLIPHMIAAAALAGLLIWQLLPRIKGAMLGLMWALKLRGDEIQGDVDRHG